MADSINDDPVRSEHSDDGNQDNGEQKAAEEEPIKGANRNSKKGNSTGE